MAKKTTNSLLWKVSGNNLPHPCYFFGTMHLMCEEDATLSGGILEVIKEVSQIYFEVDLNDIQSLSASDQHFKMRDDVMISDLLKKKELSIIHHFFDTYSTQSFANLGTIQPLMLTSTIYELMLPCSNKSGVDVKILEAALPLNKNIGGLETLEQQVSLLHLIPYKHQAKELYRLVKNIDKYRLLISEMISCYKAQDIKALQKLSTKKEAGISTYKSMLLYDRNNDWVRKFAPIVANGSTLFAVGAAHLAGQKGVLKLLERQGYKVEPMP